MHMDDLAVVPASFGWSDIGSWLAQPNSRPRDDAGNGAPPGSVLIRARDNYVVDLRSDADARSAQSPEPAAPSA